MPLSRADGDGLKRKVRSHSVVSITAEAVYLSVNLHGDAQSVSRLPRGETPL